MLKTIDPLHKQAFSLFELQTTQIMFSLSLELLHSGIFSSQTSSPHSIVQPQGTKLRLPLERTALEQVNYTKWYYGEESKRVISVIKEDFLATNGKGYLQLNPSDNSFVLSNPEPGNTDGFYYLFDFIKDKIQENGFELKDAVQEAISSESSFVEFEIFYLYNRETKQYVTVEIRSYKGEPLNISAQCSYADDRLDKVLKKSFFSCVKDVFGIAEEEI